MMHDVIVLGAGISGLACARRLAQAGAQVVVLDRADKPGGRCATRWYEGTPFDYGPLFIHGSDPSFLAAVSEAGDKGRLEGWPRRVQGRGTPCQPQAFSPSETRVAFADGLTVVPRALARGLDVRLNTQVTAVKALGGEIAVETSGGESFRARDVALAFALEQSSAVIRALGADAAGTAALVGLFSSLPCLAVAAVYRAGTPLPDWDVLYPEQDASILLVGNESSKRPGAGLPTLVIQGGARWSRRQLEKPSEEWAKELLAGAGQLLGPWAASPEWIRLHRWRYARLDPANELAAPVVTPLGSSRLGLAGDLFAPGGGVQAAWLSGDRLGQMLSGR
jgi:renalase